MTPAGDGLPAEERRAGCARQDAEDTGHLLGGCQWITSPGLSHSTSRFSDTTAYGLLGSLPYLHNPTLLRQIPFSGRHGPVEFAVFHEGDQRGV